LRLISQAGKEGLTVSSIIYNL